jgi:hypothetical protein
MLTKANLSVKDHEPADSVQLGRADSHIEFMGYRGSDGYSGGLSTSSGITHGKVHGVQSWDILR